MGRPGDGWRAALVAGAVPQSTIDAAPEAEAVLEPSRFRWKPDEDARHPIRPSRRRAHEALPDGGSVLDVGGLHVGGDARPRPGRRLRDLHHLSHEQQHQCPAAGHPVEVLMFSAETTILANVPRTAPIAAASVSLAPVTNSTTGLAGTHGRSRESRSYGHGAGSMTLLALLAMGVGLCVPGLSTIMDRRERTVTDVRG